MYLSSTAVFFQEVFKLAVCVAVVFYQQGMSVGQVRRRCWFCDCCD